jgi:hypothetical protein
MFQPHIYVLMLQRHSWGGRDTGQERRLEEICTAASATTTTAFTMLLPLQVYYRLLQPYGLLM